jgi:hypothetical protein
MRTEVMAAMQTVSIRIPNEDMEWLATLNLQGANTPSDKLRALVAQIRRQQEGAADYAASSAWMRDLVTPLIAKLGAHENQQGAHSEVVRLIAEWVPQVMALLLSESNADTTQRWTQLEDRLTARVFQLMTAVLRLGVTQKADCYDPNVMEKYLPQVIELANVIAANRKQLA